MKYILLLMLFFPLQATASEISVEAVLSSVNAVRHTALTIDPLLQEIAQQKADDMASVGYFSHRDPDTKSIAVEVKAQGYHGFVGENLGRRFRTSEGLVNGWMNSPVHALVMLFPAFEDVGIGIALDPDEAYTGKAYVVLLLGVRQ